MDKFIRELHKAFDYFNETKYNNELIEPIITVQKNTNKKKMILGWCSAMPRFIRKINGKERHFYEINITYNYLKDRPYEEIIGTLIHEICHLYHGQHNIEDCSIRGNHNENFKKEAERVGLLVEKAPRIGWSQTSLSDSLLKEIQSIGLDEEAFNVYMIEEPKIAKERKPRKKTYKYRCNCCGSEIKSTEENLEAKCITCDCEYTRVNK